MKLSKLFQLKKYRAKAAAIEQEWESQKQKLLSLPKRFGFKSVNEMIENLKMASGEIAATVKRGGKKPRKARVVVTEKTKEAVKKAVAAGHTGKQIATDLNLALGTVQRIKTASGLVRRKR